LAARLGAASPAHVLERRRGACGALEERLRSAARVQLAGRVERLRGAARALDALSPLGTLARGFAVVRRENDGVLVRDARQVGAGDRVAIRLQRGRLVARVETSTDENAGP
jgi:exodeoxyribonuclease VII large subunit